MTTETFALTRDLAQRRSNPLADPVPDYATYMLDIDGCVCSWNARASRFEGFTEEDILGEHFSCFFTPEDRSAGIPATVLQAAAIEGRFETEAWRVRKCGARYWAHVTLDTVRDRTGATVGYVKIVRDLSERQRSEEVLRRSEEQFRLLVQGVTDYAIYMLDPDGYVSSWNLGAERIKGYRPEEIIGQHFSRFYTDEDREQDLPRTALSIAQSEGRFEREGWRVRKDGTRFWANVIIDAIRADDGSLIGFAKVTRDITEKRQAQQALERTQRELFHSQKMEAVGQLTGGVAHDFNNLLMAVLGSLEIAEKRAAAGRDVTQLIKNAILGARRGASLTQRLLAFSRKQDLVIEPVDVPDLVREMSDMLQRSIGPTVEISTSFPLSLPPVYCDRNQLESAILNLAVNARDAMHHEGSLSFKATTHLIGPDDGELKAGNYVCLCLTDEGEGMDAETLENATSPFFTTKGVGKGTGLGLSMVQGLMAQSGGRLVLRSSKGAGTTAELWMPAAQNPGGVERLDAGDQTIKIPTTPSVRPLSILVVDDDPLVLTNTVLMIEDLGHATAQAQSAEEALLLLDGGAPFDLVVTDHAMPKVTGSQLAAIIRERCPGLPIVLATGYAELPQGADTSLIRLSKPFSQNQLETAIANARDRPDRAL